MSKGTRASTHNGRAGKNGAFSAKHNDRQFDTSTTDHIDSTLTALNENRQFGGDYGELTNEEHELAFYADHFGESLDRKNAGYKAKGKAAQIKTMEQYYRSVKSCPEETLYTIGKEIDPQLLWKIYLEHQQWKAETFPLCQTLDASLHVDEPNAMPHVHERCVWIGHDKDGKEVVGQAKALAEMGVRPPDMEKKYGKFNNAKQTFSKECRDHFIEICRSHGLEIEVEPLPSDKVGLDLMEYKIQHAQERASEASEQADSAEAKLSRLETEIEAQKAEIEAQKSEISNLQAELKPYKDLQVDLKAVDSMGTTIGPGLVAVKKKDLALLQEQAKAYVANKDEIDNLHQKVEDVEYRSAALRSKELEVDQIRNQTKSIKKSYEDAYQRQLDINTVLNTTTWERNELKRKLESAEQTIADQTGEIQGLRAEIASLRAGIEEKVQKAVEPLKKQIESLTAKLKGAYESIRAICQAVGLLKYGEQENAKYRASLTPVQDRLVDAAANYGAKWARVDGFNDIAEDIDKRVKISKGMQAEIDKLAPKQRSEPSRD